MPVIDIPTEQTTAVTDLLLAAVAFGCLIALQRPAADPWKTRLWTAAYACFTLASLLGALAHGIKMQRATYDLSGRRST